MGLVIQLITFALSVVSDALLLTDVWRWGVGMLDLIGVADTTRYFGFMFAFCYFVLGRIVGSRCFVGLLRLACLLACLFADLQWKLF